MKQIYIYIQFVFLLLPLLSCAEEDGISHIPIKEYMPIDSCSIQDRGAVFSNQFEFIKFADNSVFNQSAAVFQDYLVLIPKYRSTIYMYNLKEKRQMCSAYMKPMKEMLDGFDIYHCNQTCFGVDYYEDGDVFPLLYISQRAREDKRCFTEVFRILPLRSDQNDDYTSMELQLVQIIYFPPMSEKNSLGNVNTVIDTDSHLLYTYSRNNNASDANYNQCKISCFAIPDIHQEVVYLEDIDIKSSFMIDCSAYFMQGAFIRNETLYISRGATSVGYIDINVVDLKNQKFNGQYNLLENGYRWEPEGCFWYNGHLMIATGNNIWEMSNPMIE